MYVYVLLFCADYYENVGQLYIRDRTGEQKCTVTTSIWSKLPLCDTTHVSAAKAPPFILVYQECGVWYALMPGRTVFSLPSHCKSGFRVCVWQCSALRVWLLKSYPLHFAVLVCDVRNMSQVHMNSLYLFLWIFSMSLWNNVHSHSIDMLWLWYECTRWWM